MRTGMLRGILCLAAALGAGTAQGKACKGVDFPDQAQVDGAALKLNGLGLRQATFLKVNVYVAALYVAQPSRDGSAMVKANAPKELILHFVRDVGRSDLVKGWDEGFEDNAKDDLVGLKDRIESFKGMMSDMKTGQRMRFVHKPGAGVNVEIAGAPKGSVAGDDFARALFSIWLGARPPNPELKAGLLGGPCG